MKTPLILLHLLSCTHWSCILLAVDAPSFEIHRDLQSVVCTPPLAGRCPKTLISLVSNGGAVGE
jgi:hypothetical protein